MKVNVGNVDRISRILLGVGGLVAGYVGQSDFWYALGFLVILTGIVGVCPLYSLFGMQTAQKHSSVEKPSQSTS